MGSKYVRSSSQHFTPYVKYQKTPEECAQEGIAYKGYDDNLPVQDPMFETFCAEALEDDEFVTKNDPRGKYVSVEDCWYDFKSALEDDFDPDNITFDDEDRTRYNQEIYSAYEEFQIGSLLDLKADKFVKAKPNLIVFEAIFLKSDPLANHRRSVRIFKTNSKLAAGSHYVTVDFITVDKKLTKDGRVKVYITVSTF